jgi:hypothetical protein
MAEIVTKDIQVIGDPVIRSVPILFTPETFASYEEYFERYYLCTWNPAPNEDCDENHKNIRR